MPPVGAAIGAAVSAISGSAILTGLVQVAASFALSKLAQKLFGPRKPEQPKPPGETIDAMTTGELAGETFIVGRWATGGHMVYHGSYGNVGGTPNVFYTRVIELAGMPNHNLRSVILKGEFVEFDGITSIDGPLNDKLLPGSGPRELEAVNDSLSDGSRRHFWVKFYDGTQTQANSSLTSNLSGGSHPFTSDMIGSGICYAIVTYRFSRKVWQSDLEPRFVLDGIPLYDPRKDSSVGGSGAHRFDNPATWEWTANPAVIAYNVARGITLPTGDIYGGEYKADDLPLDRWVAAMNTCDEFVSDDRPNRYIFGAEVDVAETEPAELIEACMTACAGQIAAIGGKLIPQVGTPDVPVWSINDNDLSAEDQLLFEPIKGLAERFNGVQASHAAPAQLWEPRNLPLIENATWEAEDGGRRLIADLRLSGVFSAAQASELANIYINDERRQRVHQIVLPPDAARLQVFDTIQLTRPQDGYDNKLVEVVGFEQRTDDLFCSVTVREVDPTDYEWSPSQDLPEPPPVTPTPIVVQSVPGFGVESLVVLDDTTQPRRPALRLFWDAEQAEDVEALRFEIRLAGEAVAASGVEAVEAGQHIAVLLPATAYEARAQLIADRRTEWTAWFFATTPDVRISDKDVDDDIRRELREARDLIDGTVIDIGGVVGDLRDSVQLILGQSILNPELTRPDITIPRLADLESTIETVQMQIANGELLRGMLEGRVRDAGIYIDPDTAQVKIRGVQDLDEEVRLAQIRVDGLEAQVDILAQVASFDDEGLLEQFNEVQALFDAVNARIDLRASSLELDEVDVRLQQAEVTISSQGVTLSALGADLEDVDARLTSAEVNISAIDGIADITSIVEAVRQTAADDPDYNDFQGAHGLIEQMLGREFQRQERAAGRQSLSAWITDQGEAVAQQLFAIEAEVEGARADIQQESTVRASADQALAQQISLVEAEFGDSLATVTGNITALADETQALAQQATSLEASLSDLDGELEANASAINSTITQVQDLDGEVTVLTASNRVLEASLRSGANLLPNGDFSTGDFDGWQNIPSQFSVVERGGGSDPAVQSAPTPHILRITDSSSSQSMVPVQQFSAKGGDRFRVSVDAARHGSSSVFNGRLSMEPLDADGNFISGSSPNRDFSIGPANSWQSYTFDEYTAPSGTASIRFRLARLGGGSGRGFITNLRLERLSEAEIDAGAKIDTLEVVKVDASGAVAAVNQQISAEYGDLSALAEATAFAEATADGIREGFIWRTGSGGRIELISVDEGTDGPVVTARIAGDYILLDGDVEVDGSFVVSGSTVILDADTQVTETFTVGGDGTGERAVTTKDGLRVFDSNNIARIIIGKLD